MRERVNSDDKNELKTFVFCFQTIFFQNKNNQILSNNDARIEQDVSRLTFFSTISHFVSVHRGDFHFPSCKYSQIIRQFQFPWHRTHSFRLTQAKDFVYLFRLFLFVLFN